MTKITKTKAPIKDHGKLVGLSDDDHTQYLLADGTRALAGPWNMDSQVLTNVNIDSGDINIAVTQTEWDAAYSHVSNNGSDHSFIDQDVTSGSSPTYDGTNFSGIPDGALDISYIKADGTRDLTGTWTITQDISIDSDTKGVIFGDAQDVTVHWNDGGDVLEIDDKGLKVGGTGLSEARGDWNFEQDVTVEGDSTFEGEINGTLKSFNFMYYSSMTASSYLYTSYPNKPTTVTNGYVARKPGSIIGIGVNFYVVVTTGGDATFTVKVGSNDKLEAAVTCSTSGYKNALASASRGVHTFAAGDIINVYYTEEAGAALTGSKLTATVDVIFDE